MSDQLAFVQFPHPKSEHKPLGLEMPWWSGRDHARKFLRAHGRYLVAGRVKSGSFGFWGEWEPQSRVIEDFSKGVPGWPRHLHEPFWRIPTERRLWKNTDPMVFGDRFLYSNCRQQQNRKLRHLAPGSLLLFGSKLDRKFVLDTVFVVADAGIEFTRGSSDSIDCEDWVRQVVFTPLRDDRRPPDETFRLYRGRTQAETPDGPFSVVPCRPYRPGGSAFARPVIELEPRRVNVNLAMAANVTPAARSELRALWDQVVSQVVDVAGLALGVQMDAPPHQGPNRALRHAGEG